MSERRDSAVRDRRGRGFTIVELLVVVSIIALLISILIPTLSKVRETARRATCRASQRSLIQAASAYSSSNDRYYPPSQRDDGTNWAYSFDVKTSAAAPNPKLPMGLGILVKGNYLSFDPSTFHCPTLDTSHTSSGINYHCMDIPPGTNVWGAGMSWFNKTTDARIIVGYNYRSPSWFRAHNTSQMRISNKFGGDRVLFIDMFDRRFGVAYGHKDGYNFARGDGSGQWYNDPLRQIEAIAPAADGVGTAGTDEAAYSLIEKPQ